MISGYRESNTINIDICSWDCSCTHKDSKGKKERQISISKSRESEGEREEERERETGKEWGRAVREGHSGPHGGGGWQEGVGKCRLQPAGTD